MFRCGIKKADYEPLKSTYTHLKKPGHEIPLLPLLEHGKYFRKTESKRERS